MEKDVKIFIAGHKEMAALAVAKSLEEKGYTNIIENNSGEFDLLDATTVKDFFQTERPDCVFLPSYKSGSIQANINHPAEFIYENLAVQNNVIHNAYLSGVKKLVFLGASCVYPKESAQPLKEDYFLTGELESTSQPYAVAKISGIEMCRAYNRQYGTKFISVVPATLYGPGDKFDAENSHVLAGLIRKFHEAETKGEKEVLLWGTGAPCREFIYINDFADACVFILENADSSDFDLINIGTGTDISIRELAEKIKNIVGFQGEIKWDASKPDGAMKKLLDASRLNSLGWRHRVELDEGINKTYRWFVANQDKIA